MARRPLDPYGSFNFLVESNGILQAGFSEVTGLGSESEAIEYRNGNEDFTPRKLPGLKKFGNVTLKRGVAQGQDFLDWRKKVTDGNIERQEISIILLDESRNEQVRYNLAAAWPCKWMGPDLKANANEVAIETLEICHEGVSLG
jgi:phage tail-like protein